MPMTGSLSKCHPTQDPYGFISLEEIQDADFSEGIQSNDSRNTISNSSLEAKSAADNYNDAIQIKDHKKSLKNGKKVKSKKRKQVKSVQVLQDTNAVCTDGFGVHKGGGKAKVVSEIKKRKKREAIGNAEKVSDAKVVILENEENEVDEAEYYAWQELRLHSQLLKSIYRLGFKEPTPIQKACIPAAAHQGKDVIGAAETGSGKTLAFGLPILQRLMEERDKFSRMVDTNGDKAEKCSPSGLLRALIITPTRELALQVSDHLKAVAEGTNIKVIPIVGGMSKEKQGRLLRSRPEIIVGTPGRLWEIISGEEKHTVELQALSFFVLDEADRMIENGHFHELQSIIDMLPVINNSSPDHLEGSENCTTSNFRKKKRQTLVFSATISLSSDFRKKLKRGYSRSNQMGIRSTNSIESLSQRAGMRENVAVIDLTNSTVLANKLEESFLECEEDEKDCYLYYILTVHGHGSTIVFCTSIAAVRHVAAVLRILGINACTLHAQMQQRARLKAMDRFRGNENGLLIATDVAARGLDIPKVRTVIHYQLPHSAEVYVHRSGRTARASSDGCSIALISPNEASKFASLCKSFSKESFQRFPLDSSYMSEIAKRLSLAWRIHEISQKDSQEAAKRCWFNKNAESVELLVDQAESEEERVHSHKQKKVATLHLKKLKQELANLLSRPIQPKTFSRRYFAGAGVSLLLQHQFEELSKEKLEDPSSRNNKRRKLLVIGQDCVEPLQALREGGQHVHMDLKKNTEKQRRARNLKKQRKEEKLRLRDQRRNQRKMLKGL